MARRAGKFRAQLLLQSSNRQLLQRLLARAVNDEWVKRQKQKIQWSLDVDPVELI
jgi:primosomal protein N' (replication factor Y)